MNPPPKSNLQRAQKLHEYLKLQWNVEDDELQTIAAREESGSTAVIKGRQLNATTAGGELGARRPGWAAADLKVGATMTLLQHVRLVLRCRSLGRRRGRVPQARLHGHH
jgi:hypothetical protein